MKRYWTKPELASRVAAGVLLTTILLAACVPLAWHADHPFVRAMNGARATFLVAALVTALAVPVGVIAGALGAIGPAAADALLARIVELTGALPAVVLLAVIQAGAPLSPALSFALVVAALEAVKTARLVRGEILRLTAEPFVEAALALGTPPIRLIRRQLLPHLVEPVSVTATFTLATAIALEAALGFIGLSPAVPCSWGAILGQAGHPGFSADAALATAGVVSSTIALGVLADALRSRARSRACGLHTEV